MPNTHVNISLQTLSSLIGLLTGFPDPDNPLPHGPGDPVIRRALERAWIRVVGPQPDPWRNFDPTPEPWGRRGISAVLSPEPQPWRLRFAASLASEILASLVAEEEMVQLLPAEARPEAQRAISSRLGVFIDDCGNGRIRIPIPPHPRPEPHGSREQSLDSLALIVVGAGLLEGARSVSESLHKSLKDGATRLIEIGIKQAEQHG